MFSGRNYAEMKPNSPLDLFRTSGAPENRRKNPQKLSTTNPTIGLKNNNVFFGFYYTVRKSYKKSIRLRQTLKFLMEILELRL